MADTSTLQPLTRQERTSLTTTQACLFRQQAGRLYDGTQTVYTVRDQFRAIFVEVAPAVCAMPRHQYHLVVWCRDSLLPEWRCTTASERLLGTLLWLFGVVAEGSERHACRFVVVPKEKPRG